MQHTLAAVFDNRSSAQQAMDELTNSGFPRADVTLKDTSGATGMDAGDNSVSNTVTSTDNNARDDDGSIGSSIKNFFSNLFSDDDDHDASVYSEAVNRGNCVLTLNATSEDEVERAADIVERYGPIDIDEHVTQWSASGWTGAGSMRSGAGAQQASAPMSQQNMQGAQMQSGATMQQGASSPGSMQGTGSQGAMQRAGTEGQSIPVMQEELKVGKRAVQRGGVRIYQRMIETPVQENVSLREEHVSVERRPVNQQINPADVAAFKDSTFELRETAEEAVVEKTARIVEEVVVGKDVTQRDQQISDTVRRTEVEVEQLGAQEDSYFRNHWSSNYGSQGGSYDEYAPAYQYGSSMAGSAQYSGRPWDDVEPELQRSWEGTYPGSAWEKFKAAVRHGWEKMTS